MINGEKIIYEKKNGIYIIIGVILVFLCATIGLQAYKLGQLRAECEQYRIELQSAENRQRDLTDTINRCVDITKRADSIYGSTATTIGELKIQLREARKIYEDMEKLLYSFYNNSDSNNGHNSGTN